MRSTSTCILNRDIERDPEEDIWKEKRDMKRDPKEDIWKEKRDMERDPEEDIWKETRDVERDPEENIQNEERRPGARARRRYVEQRTETRDRIQMRMFATKNETGIRRDERENGQIK
ncbi:uncharacterized protein LOC134818911 [Bolinopsis microptera]|uniref:uncharacterized protein LOC134818911 n=1 Tax=Bolinopsis microptera TaxID=2820187 RepID=UPI00307AA063